MSPAPKPYLRNAWSMAAWAEEVGEGLVSRRILGRRTLLMRTSGGDVVAMEDRCPHRFAPLSMGERRGDEIVCGYHGLTFNAAGACVRNPYSEKIPAGGKVRAFPVVERDSVIWLWPGDPELADPTKIPDFSFLPDSATNRTVRGYTPMKANYQYGTDNLMDLSHIEFVHKGSFAGAGVIFAGTHSVEQDGDTLRSNWWMPGIPPPSMAAGVYPPESRVDHWLDMRWDAPASMMLEVGATPAGEPREQGLIVHQAHILTPESETTSHYFWGTSRGNDVESPELDAMLLQLFSQAFDAEDKPIIEAAFENTDGGDFWGERPIFLGIDAGGTRARRLLESLIEKEVAAQPSGIRAAR